MFDKAFKLSVGDILGDWVPMIEMGFRTKRSLPAMPTYLLLQPADHRRTTYSVPKNTTSTIS